MQVESNEYGISDSGRVRGLCSFTLVSGEREMAGAGSVALCGMPFHLISPLARFWNCPVSTWFAVLSRAAFTRFTHGSCLSPVDACNCAINGLLFDSSLSVPGDRSN